MKDRRKNIQGFSIEQGENPTIRIGEEPHKKLKPINEMLKLLCKDLLSSINRSREFNNTRADYLRLRVTALSVLMAVLFIIWIPLELMVLEPELALNISICRVISAISLLLIAYYSRQGKSLRHIQLMLTLLILSLNIFSICAQQLLKTTSSEGILFGYSLFPYLYIAILSIFPQTAVEGLRLSAITILSVTLTHYLEGTLFTFNALSDFWFLSLLTLVILSSQMEQMQMMLRLFRQGTRDPLTGLYNRGRLMTNIQMAAEYISNSPKNNRLAVMMFDLDYFKKINDNYGHGAGDDVLKGFARVLRSALRSNDVVGRYGGEEFVAMMINTPEDEVIAIAERIRGTCEKITIETRNGEKLKFTTSVGVSFFNKGENISQLLERADDNLYKAKFEGRNRVILS